MQKKKVETRWKGDKDQDKMNRALIQQKNGRGSRVTASWPLRHGRSRRSRRHRRRLGADIGGSRSGNLVQRRLSDGLAVGAVAGDVASLRALVADLAGGAQRAAIGGRAVTGDVALQVSK